MEVLTPSVECDTFCREKTLGVKTVTHFAVHFDVTWDLEEGSAMTAGIQAYMACISAVVLLVTLQWTLHLSM